MKRFHVHVNVDRLDDPRVNFAISQRDRQVGVDHLGLQAEDAAELAALGARLQAADAVALAEKATTCCYARSDKFWAEDPQGVRWESFHTHGAATTYTSAPNEAGATCCGPAAASASAAACEPTTAGSCC